MCDREAATISTRGCHLGYADTLRSLIKQLTTKGDADLGRRFYFKRNPQLSDLDLLGTPVALKTFSG